MHTLQYHFYVFLKLIHTYQSMKNAIENKKVWIEVTNETDSTRNSCCMTADQQNCSDCGRWKWVMGFVYNGKSYDGLCPKCLTDREQVCDKRHCMFCNKTAKFQVYTNTETGKTMVKVCKSCITSVTENTRELYKVCEIPDTCHPRCKFCVILGRGK